MFRQHAPEKIKEWSQVLTVYQRRRLINSTSRELKRLLASPNVKKLIDYVCIAEISYWESGYKYYDRLKLTRLGLFDAENAVKPEKFGHVITKYELNPQIISDL